MTTISITARDNHVLIGREQPGIDLTSLTTIRLGMAGGVLDFAIEHSSPIPAADIWDMDAAAWWLPLVYGDVITEEALDLVETNPTTEVTVGPFRADEHAPILDTLRRLALGLWMRRWRPVRAGYRNRPDFLPWLLDAECASLTIDAESALADSDAMVVGLLAPHLAELAAEVTRHHHRADADADGQYIDEVISRAAEDGLNYLDPSEQGWDLVDRATKLRSQEESEIAAFVANLDEAFRNERLTRALEEASLHAGTSSEISVERPVRSGTISVDPRTVPARIFDDSEHAIRWELFVEQEAVRVEVFIAAAHRPQHRQTDLFTRVEIGDDAADARLARVATGYQGTVWLPLAAQVEAAVVHVSTYGGVPNSDSLPMRPVSERDNDHAAIDAVLRTRTSLLATSDELTWNAPFAAELITHARGSA